MESVEVVTCGVPGHTEECLCDVVITDPAPIRRDAVQGLWMGQEVADACGYENWDDDQELLSYLCDVLLLHDRFVDQQSVSLVTEPMRPYGTDTTIHPYRVIRVNISSVMAEPGTTIADALTRCGVSAEEFTSAASSGHWTMDLEKLVRFEQTIQDPSISYNELGRRFDMDPATCKRFRKFWPHAPKAKPVRGLGHQPHHQRMRQLIADGVGPTEVTRIIHDEFGVTIGKCAVSQMKRRYGL